MSFAPADHDDYVMERLVEFVKATIEKAKRLADVDSTASPEMPETPERSEMLNVAELVAEFMMIVRALRPESRVDDVFAEFHGCIRNLPEEMRLEEDELYAFGADYSVTTRIARVKGDEEKFQVLMAMYEHARQAVKEFENLLEQMYAAETLDQLLKAQMHLQDMRVRLDGFVGYRMGNLQDCACFFYFRCCNLTDGLYCSAIRAAIWGVLVASSVSWIVMTSCAWSVLFDKNERL